MKYGFSSFAICLALSISFGNHAHADRKAKNAPAIEMSKQEIPFLVSQCANHLLARAPIDEQEFEARGYREKKGLFGLKKTKRLPDGALRNPAGRKRLMEFRADKPEKRKSCSVMVQNGSSFRHIDPLIFASYEENGFEFIKDYANSTRFHVGNSRYYIIKKVTYGTHLYIMTKSRKTVE